MNNLCCISGHFPFLLCGVQEDKTCVLQGRKRAPPALQALALVLHTRLERVALHHLHTIAATHVAGNVRGQQASAAQSLMGTLRSPLTQQSLSFWPQPSLNATPGLQHTSSLGQAPQPARPQTEGCA